MKLFKSGDASKGVCPDCAAIVPTTFGYRDMPLDGAQGEVKGILVEICNKCDLPVTVPAQSIPAIKRALAKPPVSLNVKVPASDIEILDVAADRIAPVAEPTQTETHRE